MSLLDTQIKQPIEKLDYDIEYADWLTPGDGVTASNVTVTVDAPSLTVAFFTTSGTVLKIWLTGGTHGVTYRVSVTVETDDGRIKQDEFKVKVKEI